MRATVALVALLAGLVLIQVQPCMAQAPSTTEAQDLANETVAKGRDLLGDTGNDVAGLTDQVPAAGDGRRGGLAGAADAIGRFVGQVASVIGAGAIAAVTGLAQAGAAISGALASALVGGLKAMATGLTALGAALGATLAAAASGVAAASAWLSAQVAALVAMYASFVQGMRPRTMDARLFSAIAVAGTTASAGAAGYGLWALARKFGWLLAPIAGFTRIANSELLDHPLRAQVFQVIQANPGIHASELSRKVGAGWGTITHHLEKLEKGRLVTTRRVNNQKCYFEDGGKVSSADMAVAGAVRGDSAGQITAYVQSHPMTSQKAMAEQLGMSAALASFHVKKLVGIGVLEKVRRGKETLLTTTIAVRRVMAQPESIMAPVAMAQA